MNTREQLNIFVLDTDINLAARYHNDRHIVKGILEAVQMMSTAHVELDGANVAFKRVPDVHRSTNILHPCSVWARSSSEAYDWLYLLLGALLEEHRLRFGREHPFALRGARRPSLYAQLSARPANVPKVARPPFALAMPIAYRRPDPVEAYRLYYTHEKAHLAHWSHPADVPPWWPEMLRRRA